MSCLTIFNITSICANVYDILERIKKEYKEVSYYSSSLEINELTSLFQKMSDIFHIYEKLKEILENNDNYKNSKQLKDKIIFYNLFYDTFNTSIPTIPIYCENRIIHDFDLIELKTQLKNSFNVDSFEELKNKTFKMEEKLNILLLEKIKIPNELFEKLIKHKLI